MNLYRVCKICGGIIMNKIVNIVVLSSWRAKIFSGLIEGIVCELNKIGRSYTGEGFFWFNTIMSPGTQNIRTSVEAEHFCGLPLVCVSLTGGTNTRF